MGEETAYRIGLIIKHAVARAPAQGLIILDSDKPTYTRKCWILAKASRGARPSVNS